MPVTRTAVALTIAAALAVAAACTGSAADPEPPLPTAERCGALADLDLIDLRIASAQLVPAADRGPEHCAVTGVIETEINFELLLPSGWNGRFMMGGGGGYVGSVQNQALTLFAHGGSPLERGYATVGTDTGHAGGTMEASWALNNPERQENFGHRAVHLTAEAAKSILRHYYGEPEAYSYFVAARAAAGRQ